MRMKKFIPILSIFVIQNTVFAQNNILDKPLIEVSAKVDTLVIPDKIYISINLNEEDSKNKISVEHQEIVLEKVLKSLDINIEKDLSLLDFSSNFKYYFFRGQNVIKSKTYSLLVKDAQTAGKVLIALENSNISNVNIEKIEYSKSEELILELKSKAVEKSKIIAERLVKPLNQKVGKSIWISDNIIWNTYDNNMGIQIRGAKSLYKKPEALDPINIEFKKIKLEAQISIKYLLE